LRKITEPVSVKQDRKTNEQTAFGLGRMPLLDFGREIFFPLFKARKRMICVEPFLNKPHAEKNNAMA